MGSSSSGGVAIEVWRWPLDGAVIELHWIGRKARQRDIAKMMQYLALTFQALGDEYEPTASLLGGYFAASHPEPAPYAAQPANVTDERSGGDGE